MMSIRVHPSTVEFGELECCALRKAIAENNHQPFIVSFIASVGATNPPYQVNILFENFLNTIRFVFTPSQIHRFFYLILALREKKFIERREDATLDCKHFVKQHQEALANICAKMAYPKHDQN
ncbi:MAG TPA: hypothetical protein VJK04_01235 [Candidatus Paceibacterota bacterium]